MGELTRRAGSGGRFRVRGHWSSASWLCPGHRAAACERCGSVRQAGRPHSRALAAPPCSSRRGLGARGPFPNDRCRERATGPAARPAEVPMLLGVPLRATVLSGWRVLRVRSLLPPDPPSTGQLCRRGVCASLWVGRPGRLGVYVEMRGRPAHPSGEPDVVSAGSH